MWASPQRMQAWAYIVRICLRTSWYRSLSVKRIVLDTKDHSVHFLPNFMATAVFDDQLISDLEPLVL